jgi:hypothetical protein
MGKYSGLSPQRESSSVKSREPHPIWRGIGCLMIVFIPAVSIFIGNGVVKYALDQHWRIPPQLLGFPQLPDIIYKSSGLKAIFIPLARIPNLYAYIFASILFMILISTVISFIYAVVYRIANPNRYGPLDAPPSKIKAKKHSR